MADLSHCPLIDITQITIKPGRVRKEFKPDALEEMKTSIRAHGIIQPLALDKQIIAGEEKIVLIAGERRWRASLQLVVEDPKYRFVPYMWKKDTTELDQKKMELDENLRRENLTEWEKNELYYQIQQMETATRGTTRGDPNAFKLSELAAKTGEAIGGISTKINFHRQMLARPDVLAQVKDKPITVAMKEAKRIIEAEQAAAAVKIGTILVSQDFKIGDCRELITQIGNETVDAICTDFPFAIPDLQDSSGESQQYTGLMKHSDNLTTKEVDQLIQTLAPHLFRILKPSGYFACFFGWDCKYFMEYYFKYVGFIVDIEPIIWDKQSTTNSFKGYSPAPCYEQMMWCVKPPRDKRMSESWKKIISFPPVKKDLRTHVFEKPVELWNYVIKRITNVGDVVYDPCAGTGSVLAACMELKRTGIGHEIDQQHYALGCQRLHLLGERLAGGQSCPVLPKVQNLNPQMT